MPIHLSCRHSEHPRTSGYAKPIWPLYATSTLIFGFNTLTYIYSPYILTTNQTRALFQSTRLSSPMVDKMAQQDVSQDRFEPPTSCASNVFRTALALPFGATDSFAGLRSLWLCPAHTITFSANVPRFATHPLVYPGNIDNYLYGSG